MGVGRDFICWLALGPLLSCCNFPHPHCFPTAPPFLALEEETKCFNVWERNLEGLHCALSWTVPTWRIRWDQHSFRSPWEYTFVCWRKTKVTLLAAFCSDLYSQLKPTEAFPAKISAGVSIHLFLLSEAPARGFFWQVLDSFPSHCGWQRREGNQ